MSRPVAVHQVVPVFAGRDAIGSHTVQLQALLRDQGYVSDIFTTDAHAEVRHLARPIEELDAAAGPAWIIYQCSTGHPVADALVERSEPLVLDYHNITPVELFAPWEPIVGGILRDARRQLARLAPRAVLGLADSAYNAAELERLGCPATAVAPILLDPGQFDAPPDAARLTTLEAARAEGGADWLFVGRVAPNKAQHDLVLALAAARRLHDPQARLHIVGGDSSHRYLTAVRDLVHDLGLDDAVDLAGSVSPGELAAHYRTADVFVCLSDHEGFCVPLLEAMHHGVPIVAYGSSAVPETLGGAGLCLADKHPVTVAAAVDRVVTDDVVRDALVAAGHRRSVDFGLGRTRQAFVDALDELADRL